MISIFLSYFLSNFRALWYPEEKDIESFILAQGLSKIEIGWASRNLCHVDERNVHAVSLLLPSQEASLRDVSSL